MVLTLAFAAALLVQTPHTRQPVGVWRSDSTLYVTLRQPGDLLVLHVDAIGRIQVPFQPLVCLSCVRHGAPAVATATAIPTNAVDCSNASLTNAFCGVNSGSVSIASAPPAPPQVVYQPAPAPVYVPYFLPMAHGF